MQEEHTTPEPLLLEERSTHHFFEDAKPEKHPYRSVIPVLPELSVALGVLILMFAASYVDSLTPTTSPEPEVYVNKISAPIQERILTSADAYRGLLLAAESAIVWDVREQKALFSKNPNESLPLASITKLMTALLVYELLDPEDKVAISEHAVAAEGDSGLYSGEVFDMKALADLTLLTSSNDGAVALGDYAANAITSEYDPETVFITAMNTRAGELGLSHTYFKNSTGLDISETEAGAYGSAQDMVKLMEFLITNVPEAVELTALDGTQIYNLAGEYHVSENTNGIVNSIDGLIASKTGYTALAGGNLVIAFDAGLNRPIIVAVLGSTYNERFTDTLALVRRTQTLLRNQ